MEEERGGEEEGRVKLVWVEVRIGLNLVRHLSGLFSQGGNEVFGNELMKYISVLDILHIYSTIHEPEQGLSCR